MLRQRRLTTGKRHMQENSSKPGPGGDNPGRAAERARRGLGRGCIDAGPPEEDRRARERARAPGAGRSACDGCVPLGRVAASTDRHRLGGASRSASGARSAARARRARGGRRLAEDRGDDRTRLAGRAARRAHEPLLAGDRARAAVSHAPADGGAPPGSVASADGGRRREGGRPTGNRSSAGADAGRRPGSGCHGSADVRWRRAGRVPADSPTPDSADAGAAGDGHRVRLRAFRRGRRGVEARRCPAPGTRPGRRGSRLHAQPRRRDGPRAGGGGGAAWALAPGCDPRRRGDRARRAEVGRTRFR